MKYRKIHKKPQKNAFNDLLLPIFCVLCLMPFCIYLAEYDYGYRSYLWHSDHSVAQDLYAYYRCYFFELIAVISLAVLILRMTLYREKNLLSVLVVCRFAALMVHLYQGSPCLNGNWRNYLFPLYPKIMFEKMELHPFCYSGICASMRRLGRQQRSTFSFPNGRYFQKGETSSSTHLQGRHYY